MGGEMSYESIMACLSLLRDALNARPPYGPELPSLLSCVHGREANTGKLYLIHRGEALEHQRTTIPEWSDDAPFRCCQFHMHSTSG